MNKIENDNLINIVTDASNGVDGAFEELYKKTIRFSYGVASVLLKNEEDIEDALQNSYMHVANSIKDLKNPESFESWLVTIVRHECQKYIAKNKKVGDIFVSVLNSKEFELLSEDSVPNDLIEKKEINETVRRIVDSLPDDKRACIALYYFERKSVSEIAEILGIPEGTVKSRLHNGRKTLEKKFKKLKKGNEDLYGVSVIPLVAAFLAYQVENVAVPASVAEGASVCIAAAGSGAAASAASGVSVAGGTATVGTTAAGAAGTAVAAKVTAVAVAAAVATGGGITAVNYAEKQKEAESTRFSQVSITEEYTTAAKVTEETTLTLIVTETENILTETSFKKEKTTVDEEYNELTTKSAEMPSEATTEKAVATKPLTTSPKTTKKETTVKKTTTKKATTTQKVTTTKKRTAETTEPTTAEEIPVTVPTTDASDIYDVSGGILSEYTGEGGNVSIPSSVGGDSVTAIGTGAFAGNSDITSVFVPSTVTKIGQEAFADCANLKSVALPSSLRSIGIGAFCDCTSLTGISVPSEVTSIGDDAFAGCSALATISIPSSVTSIGDNAFGGCDNLTIKCSEGSAAHDYAVENSIEFELI